ncbi:alpha/beta hydrolase [Marinicauda pacifica]|uniref:alpha/beta hydrolase n=1 Tax=Marinicauda pacifica TaxID=1133559 RepID=UPI0035C86031
MVMLKTFLPAAAASLLSASAFAQPVLEPQTQAFVDAASAGTPIHTLSYADARAVLASVQSPAIASAPTTVEDLTWPVGPTGEVRVRIVRPEGAEGVLPVLMFFPGGGWVLGDRNTHDHLIRELSAQANAAVVFVEYDNAPELIYPDNNEQGYAALEYVAAHGAALNLDAGRIAVAGDSAGGNMAAAITMMSQARGGPEIIHQVLFYPVTDDISANGSYTLFGDGPFLTEAAMHYFLDANYPAHRRGEVLAFPLKAPVEDLAGLPSATVIVAENDLLRDEGEAYARKLIQAGVAVTSTRYIGTIHDFVMLNALAGTPAAQAAITQASAELRDAFDRQD